MTTTELEQRIIELERLKKELALIPIADITLCYSRTLQIAIIENQDIIIEYLMDSNLLEIKKRCSLPTVCSTRQGRMRWPARKKIRIPGSGI